MMISVKSQHRINGVLRLQKIPLNRYAAVDVLFFEFRG